MKNWKVHGMSTIQESEKQAKEKNFQTRGIQRGRAWTFVLYADDYPFEYYKTYLERLQVPCAISPLHHGDSEESLNHYHVLMLFQGNKTAQSLYDDFGADLRKKGDYRLFKKVSSISAVCRYLIHLDNPDKEQFENGKNEITCLNGFDLEKYFQSESDEIRLYSEMIDFIFDKMCTYQDLARFSNRYKKEWLPILLKRSYAIMALCKSVNYGKK